MALHKADDTEKPGSGLNNIGVREIRAFAGISLVITVRHWCLSLLTICEHLFEDADKRECLALSA